MNDRRLECCLTPSGRAWIIFDMTRTDPLQMYDFADLEKAKAEWPDCDFRLADEYVVKRNAAGTPL